MNYYYEVNLNFQDKYYSFYEWDSNDTIEFIRKIPIFYIDTDIFIDILLNKIHISKEFLSSILDKTKLKGNKVLKYACIFSDGKNSLGVEFDNLGNSISKSSLSILDDISIIEFMYGLSKSKIDIEIICKEDKRILTRQDEVVKRLLSLEVNKTYKDNNLSKLKYLYLEWCGKLSSDIDYIYKDIMSSIDKEITIRDYNLYKIIKDSYA